MNWPGIARFEFTSPDLSSNMSHFRLKQPAHPELLNEGLQGAASASLAGRDIPQVSQLVPGLSRS